MMSTLRNRYIIFTSFCYLVFASLWILVSDQLLSSFANIDSIVWFSTAKGVFFVLASGLFFFLVQRAVPNRDDVNDTQLKDIVFSGAFLGRRSHWLTYTFAIGITIAMLVVRYKIGVFADHRPLMILYMFPIILSALFGGFGPGLVSTILISLGANYLFIQPLHTLRISDPYDLLQWCSLIVYGIMISIFSEIMMNLRDKAEGNLKLLNVAVSGSKDAIFVKDIKGRYLFINEAAANLVNKSISDILGHDDHYIFPSDSAQILMGRDRGIMARGKVQNHEEQITTFDGKQLILDVTKGPMFDEAGNVIGLFGITRDITRRKQNESNLRIAAIAFDSQNSILITDASQKILDVNKAFMELFGYTREEVIGKSSKILQSGNQSQDFYESMWKTISTKGSWQGEILNRHKNGKLLTNLLTITEVKDLEGVITHYVGSHVDITEQKAAADEIRYLAFHDLLTKLPNRQLFIDRLQHALSSSERTKRLGALLFIDLDNFKTLNDTLGHDVGDVLLQQVAERLILSLQMGDTVARLGGDEFMVLLEDLSDDKLEAARSAEKVAERILNSISQPFMLVNSQYDISSSIGVTIFEGYQLPMAELLKQADISMYQAKKSGRNRIRFFDPEMQNAFNAKVVLEMELRNALGNAEFQLYYQVQVNKQGKPLGAEALIRWIHPKRGLVPPHDFISLAEETGLILPIGQWVIASACAQLKEWEKSSATKNLTISVNVSAKQFSQVEFARQVQAIITQYKIKPKRLKLELTESVLLENIDSIVITMIALESIGVMFSLDDFGTGYSSLQYLKKLPLNELKIDQSFVRDIVHDSSDESIVSTIIAMAKGLKFKVIAEGVETEGQRKVLLAKGCQSFQGYLFGKPQPIDEFNASLAKKTNA
ncbi:MAG: EAL domain-containing protein [Methylophilus sp.]